jgi:PAS domain-containing protein
VEFVLRRTHPDDRARVQQTIDHAVRGSKDLDFEYRLLMPDGSVKYVNVVGLAWKEDESGPLEFVGAITDITERKHAEEILRRSEAYLSEAQRLSHTGSWAGIPATGEHTYWSEEAFRVLGFDPAERPPRFEELQRRFHPDDRARTTEHFKTAIREVLHRSRHANLSPPAPPLAQNRTFSGMFVAPALSRYFLIRASVYPSKLFHSAQACRNFWRVLLSSRRR